ncbi:hypothetical protein [Enterococcus sp. CWB-B31]|nr:hypothetical protein [Enterococcus sp. CWB-B31]MCB5956204.1 hypothetical protein [Enterococcus sp. CWB-B31]
MEDMPLIWEYFQYGFYATSQYGNYDSRIGVMNASDEELAWYGELINTRFIYPGTPEDAEIFTSAKPAVKISNHIIKVYRAVSLPLLFLSLIGYLVIIWQMVKNKFKEEHTTLFIIVTGLFLSFIILLFGVAWFSTWATDRKELFMTLYTGGGVPVIQVFKLLCLYSLGAFVKEKVKKKDISPVNE